MPELYDDGNAVILRGEEFDLKIDGNRIIYAKSKKSSVFSSINQDVPYGLSREEKKRFLVELYEKMKYRMKLEEEQQELQEK